MGKVKEWYRSVPIWLTVFLYAAAALVGASFLSNQVTGTAYVRMTGLTVNYILRSGEPVGRESAVAQATVDGYFNVNQGDYEMTSGKISSSDGDGSVTTWVATINQMSEEDAHRYAVLQQLTRYAPFFIYSGLFLAAALTFYFTKLKRPLALLETASAKIADNDLDFTLQYAGRDEMAELCAAFEKMRSALDENNRQMLSVLDERRQLNDAYTHDLRTPIAVLKGYTDMLVKYLPTGQLPQEEVVDTVRTMSSQVVRLEQFVCSMNAAQRLADLTVQREEIPAEEYLSTLRETADILAENTGKQVEWKAEPCPGDLSIDPAAVTQVFENLLGNALRFASSRITVQAEKDGDTFTLQVSDDGPGFTEKELLTAVRPYYSRHQEGETYHFGLGLHICRILCEKHGGALTLSNGPGGGAMVSAAFDTRGPYASHGVSGIQPAALEKGTVAALELTSLHPCTWT